MARGADQHQNPQSDIQIAQAATMRPIGEIAGKLGIPDEAVSPYGRYKAKIGLDYIETLKDRPNGKLILVTAITPTPAGEGKTTTTVGLGDALNHIGKKAIICLREPSLGPSFGMKGGAAGGGYAQVVPMEDINLHFTGDFHAIGAANNLLAAMVDNHIYWGNELGIDSRRVTWRRGLDMNDRALRSIVSSLGGVANGFPREDGFDIVVASEVMAIFCLATDLADLKRRLGNIIVGQTRAREPVRASDLKAPGAMAVLLKDAIAPNLVQTLENNPAFIHGGPFANIAHGCNSVIATTTALKLADYVVTEAGFGADLGAEKFIDIKCRKAGLKPDAAVVVATVRALKMHGGVPRDQLRAENVAALEAGFANLAAPSRKLARVRRAGGGLGQPLQRRHRGRARQAQGIVRRAGNRGGHRRSLGLWRRGRRAGRRGGGAAHRQRLGRFQVSLSRRDAAARQDQDDRAEDLPGARHRLRRRGREPARRIAEGRVRAISRCASPRRSTASRPTRTRRGRRPTTSSACARSGCRPAPSSSSRSAARS